MHPRRNAASLRSGRDSPGESRVVIPKDLIAPGIIDEDDCPATAYPSMGHAFDLHPLVEPHIPEVIDNALRIAIPGIECERGPGCAGRIAGDDQPGTAFRIGPDRSNALFSPTVS